MLATFGSSLRKSGALMMVWGAGLGFDSPYKEKHHSYRLTGLSETQSAAECKVYVRLLSTLA